jgi:hypothetical protein
MDGVKVVDAGEHLVITSGDRHAVTIALEDLARRGSRVSSEVTQIGANFTATASHPTAPDAGPDEGAGARELERLVATGALSVSDAGTHLVLSGSERGGVEHALRLLDAQGMRQLGAIARVGARWIASCAHPAHVESPCTVEQLGLKAVISARHRAQVDAKLDELRRGGATLVAAPELRDGLWTAIVDLGEKQHGMRFY